MSEQPEIKGTVVIQIYEDGKLSIGTNGVMASPPYLSMAADYLAKYKDDRWKQLVSFEEEDHA